MRMISTKTAGKTLADRFASCENVVGISFKRMYGKYPPPPPQLLPTIPPVLVGKIVKYRLLPEPIRLQDLEDSTRL